MYVLFTRNAARTKTGQIFSTYGGYIFLNPYAAYVVFFVYFFHCFQVDHESF